MNRINYIKKRSFLSSFFQLLFFVFLLISVVFTCYKAGVFIASRIAPESEYLSTIKFTNRILELTNEERKKAGCNPVYLNDQLTKAAFERAKYLGGYENITIPAHEGWYQTVSKFYQYKSAGENLAQGFDTQEEAFKALMVSETHRENILDCNYIHLGVDFYGDIIV